MFELHHGKAEQVLANHPENIFHSIVTDPPYGLKFMGKKWDYDVPSVLIWQAIYRSLKPGGYLIAFSGTRTYHRMAVNIEDAGFQIRDMISWVYGSGFPKSLNVGKAVDQLQGNKREVIGKRLTGSAMASRSLGRGNSDAGSGQNEVEESKGVSEWEGWGTALKPAFEPIIIARKPLSEKTIAQNVIKHHTGAINIDASRISLNGETPPSGSAKLFFKGNQFTTDKIYGTETETNSLGRFPSNFIHDGSPEVIELFPSKAGAFAPVKKGSSAKTRNIYNKYNDNGDDGLSFYNDSGSAARFFYCAKASKHDRNEGCENIAPSLETDRQNDSTNLANRLHNKSNTLNNHPTVKPTTIMRYLVRLVTPPGGLVCDPFTGSGSTGKACMLEGFRFFGIDQDAQNIPIAHARITHAIEQSTSTPNSEL
jgi:site-specific DNA-methyltransferase (adenine-specific)